MSLAIPILEVAVIKFVYPPLAWLPTSKVVGLRAEAKEREEKVNALEKKLQAVKKRWVWEMKIQQSFSSEKGTAVIWLIWELLRWRWFFITSEGHTLPHLSKSWTRDTSFLGCTFTAFILYMACLKKGLFVNVFAILFDPSWYQM